MNHLRTIPSNPPPVCEKLSSKKPVPVPERLGTAALDHLKKCLSHTQAETKSLPGLMIGGVLSQHPEHNYAFT